MQTEAPDHRHSDGLAGDLAAQLAASQRELARVREALRAAEAREEVLSYELQHRVRNMIATLRSVFRRTRENGAFQDEFAEHFEGRLGAISRYQADLIGIRSGGIELEDMVRNELFDVHCVDGPNCKIVGPPVRLRQKWAELMGLAIHELTTNAIKYGALRHGGGLSVKWSLVGGDPETLAFRWKETGVALLSAAPRPRGFGQDLIEEALPYELGATTSFELKPGGLECVITLPLPPSADIPQSVRDAADDAAAFLPSEMG